MRLRTRYLYRKPCLALNLSSRINLILRRIAGIMGLIKKPCNYKAVDKFLHKIFNSGIYLYRENTNRYSTEADTDQMIIHNISIFRLKAVR